MFIEFVATVFNAILKFVEMFGYLGIFIMTFIESTFIPIPSELTLIPAGYLISQKEMHIFPVMIVSLSGTLLGSLLNYFIACKFGRKLFINYGKYFFLKPGQLMSLEIFFNKYGNISTFFGRMLPGIKHFISFPAGLAKMNLKLFCIYTFLGSLLWLSFLLTLGYMIENNNELIVNYVKRFNFIVLSIVIALFVLILLRKRR